MKESQMAELRMWFCIVCAVVSSGWITWLWIGMSVFYVWVQYRAVKKEDADNLMRLKLMLEHIARVEGIDLKNKEKADESAKSS